MSHYRIGYISGHRSYGYGLQLASGVRNAVMEQGHTFIKIADQSEYHAKGNAFDYFKVAFELAAKLDLDAYIVPAGMIYQFCMKQTDRYSKEKLDEIANRSLNLIRRMDPKRTLVIERTFEDYRSIDKDNEHGMRECIRHLIEDHGYQKIAFISGPEYSNSAKIREGVYFEEMAAHGLETPERLFIRGSYNGKCDDVVERLLDGNDDIEAIVCACDEIALAVYRVFAKRGMRAGRDIAVTGYDDIAEAVHAAPPLSTVQATGYDLGYMAGYEAVRLAAGLPQKDTVLKSRFVNRGSCGESLLSSEELFIKWLREDPVNMDAIVHEFVRTTYTQAEGAITEMFYHNIREFCAKSFEAYQWHVAHPNDFIHFISNQMVAHLLEDAPTKPYFSVSGFQTTLDAYIHALRTVVPREEQVWVADQAAHAHLQITRIFYNQHSFDISKFAEMEMDTIQIVDDALSEEKRKQTFERILKDISGVGVPYARICIFDNAIPYTGRDKIIMPDKGIVKGHLVQKTILHQEYDQSYPLRQFFKSDLENNDFPKVCTVSALIAAGEVSGFVVLDGDSLDFEQQLAIILLISYAVKHLQMIDYQQEMVQLLQENNIMLTHQSQQDELTGLFNRRGFMQTVGILLKNNVERDAAVFYLDLDGLKVINDSFGHEIGDEAIIHTSQILSSCFRSSDILARQGGDEFVAFSLLKEPTDAEVIVQRVEEKMKTFNEEHDKVYTLSISIGFKTFLIEEGGEKSLEKWMTQADEMLYEVKRRKKGKARFEAEMKR
ncbi:MAG: diguanylate cyclase [Lachnospiraceae bacterium]|nr:diguanylate cyclase [Lachnospiraceae bacterium]